MTAQIKRWKEDFDVATAENWLDAMFGRGKMRVRDGYIPVAGKNCKVFGKSRIRGEKMGKKAIVLSIFLAFLALTQPFAQQTIDATKMTPPQAREWLAKGGDPNANSPL